MTVATKCRPLIVSNSAGFSPLHFTCSTSGLRSAMPESSNVWQICFKQFARSGFRSTFGQNVSNVNRRVGFAPRLAETFETEIAEWVSDLLRAICFKRNRQSGRRWTG